VEIEALDEVAAALNRLLPQLSSTAPPLDSGKLRLILAAEGTTVLVARCGARIRPIHRTLSTTTSARSTRS
jgi:hypothetical protein